jgi:Fur family ferric uptake transcriptional regulator
MRNTRQREVVLDAVRSTMEHPTADWVYRRARRRIPRISLGTVYRNLRQLAEAGVIREIHAGGPLFESSKGKGAVRFDGNTGPHHHVRCVRCGRVNDLAVELDARRERAAARALDFEVLGHHVEVQGVCRDCRPHSSHHRRSLGPVARSRPPGGTTKP